MTTWLTEHASSMGKEMKLQHGWFSCPYTAGYLNHNLTLNHNSSFAKQKISIAQEKDCPGPPTLT
jgi:hypothetical protein